MTDVFTVHRVEHPMHEQTWNDQQLMQPVTQPRIRVWTYNGPGLVLGCSQRQLQTEGATVRNSGGGAVLTGPWMLSVSVVLPHDHHLVTPGLVQSYKWFGLAHQTALEAVGVQATALSPEAVKSMPTKPELAWACFGSCSAWEVIASQRKLVGIAQRRARHGVLLTAGTLTSTPDWSSLARLLPKHADSLCALADYTTSCEQEAKRAIPPERLAKELVPLLLGEVSCTTSEALLTA